MSNTSWGIILIVISALLAFWRQGRKIAPIAVFIGILLVGVGGWLLGALSKLTQALQGWFGQAVGGALGHTVPALFAIVLAVIFIHEVRPKGSAKPHAYPVAIMLALLISAGVTGVQALNSLPAHVDQGVTTIRTGGH